MLPAIRRQAWLAFRHLNPEARDEMVQEVVANAFVAYQRLVELGRVDIAYPTPLASNGIRQAKAGRRVGGKLNACDITSPHCQIQKGVRVGRLDHYDADTDEWKEILIEDRRAGPAQTAAARIDFGDWMAALPSRLRRIAKLLAAGESTGSVAKRFNISSGRISQLRRVLKTSWETFQGGPRTELTAACP